MGLLVLALVDCMQPARPPDSAPASPSAAHPGIEPPPGLYAPLVFVHVSVIDATGAPAQPDRTVVVQDGRIAAIGQTGRLKIPRSARLVDGSGKFLIPGLWDMHAHLIDEDDGASRLFTLFVANGVTGIRHMSGTMFGCTDLLQWRRESWEGTAVIPRIFAASNLVDGPDPQHEGSIVVRDVAQGRQAVVRIQQEGWDMLKIYEDLPREVYLAILDEARNRDLPVAGHVSWAVSAGEAASAGLRSIEHLHPFMVACSAAEAECRQELLRAVQSNDDVSVIRAQERALDNYSETKATEIFQCLVHNGTWECPTLTLFRPPAMPEESLVKDPRLRFLPQGLKTGWAAASRQLRSMLPEADGGRGFRRLLAMVGSMHQAGVRMVAGTDTPNPYCLPGFGLHDELQLLVEAGLTPMEALRTATGNVAQFDRRLSALGTIEPGKLADLVLLDANPLEDIRNTQRIRAVVLGGRLLERAELDRMLAGLEASAGKK